MPWWGWIASGLALLGVEMLVIDTGFYLVFLGASALMVGFIVLPLEGTPMPLQWMLFGILALVSLVGFRSRVYARLRAGGRDLPEGVSGESAVAIERIEPGATGRVELRGTPWSARNVGTTPIERGSHPLVVRTESVLLFIRAESQ